MKALVFREYGGPEVLKIEELPDPVPGFGDVVVDLKATALNHVDIDVREGVSRFDFAMPHTLGLEGAGIISLVGDGVDPARIGERVAVSYIRTCGHCEWCLRGMENICVDRKLLGEHVPGTYAQKILTPADHCLTLPDTVDFGEAAAALSAFGTAWHALMIRAEVKLGETVLIHSIGGGVASAALQICKAAGATVIGTASRDDKLAQATADGADHVVNYSTTDVRTAVDEITGGRGVELVFDAVGGTAFTESMFMLRPYGRLVSIGAHAGEIVEFDIIEFFRRQISYISSHTQTRDEMRTVLDLVGKGVLRPRINSRYPLDRAGEAHEELASRTTYGKIILDID
ncbi:MULTISPECIES: zinc-binding dehydrogenase [Nocardiaceae]|uniref:NADPH:quinone reductase-like Zn-dependent oxidoreductase n=1 Tax=Rhodococcoides corynebacterioides TaxID=53972 RepID=A0ABS2L0C3_9NOCA|nr:MULTISPECIES: zinc-binding dehydrogenase [Rhodococcus]MBM7417016.1 NADPH:quinone reductase-like Zn-dependent oxidoreductase [Rhodococcus corynebacterioides]MBP1115269.1 NADPH:quinone reductase-like Zn-dependent oxidoreductase [Rhodococcus sp. PvP016]